MSNIRTYDFSDELTTGLSAMMFQQPFFAHLMLELMTIIEVVPDKGDCTVDVCGRKLPVQTAATDGKSIWVNSDFIKGMDASRVVFLLCHEVSHVIYEHMARAKGYFDMKIGPDMKQFSPKKWNKAGDYVINAQLHQMNIGTMPDGGLLDSAIKYDELIDEVYMRIPDDDEVYMRIPDDDDEDGDEDGDGSNGHGGFDQHVMPDQPATDADAANIKRAVAQAANTAKALGQLPSDLERLVDSVMNPRIRWEDQLEMEVCKNASKDEPDFKRPNRRKLAMTPQIILPSRTGQTSGVVAVELDTSGSISDTELAYGLGVVKGIMERTCPEQLILIWTHAEVWHVETLEDITLLDGVIKRVKEQGVKTGGTDMTAGFAYLDEWNIQPDQMVVFTDGYTPFGEQQPYPVIWAITQEGISSDWGRTLHVDLSHGDDR